MKKKRVSGPRVTGKGPLKSTVNIVYGNDPKPPMEPGDIYATLKNYREKAFSILPEYKSPSTMSELELAAFKVVCIAKGVEEALQENDAPAAALRAMHLHDAMMHIRIRKEKSAGPEVQNKMERENALMLANEYKRSNTTAGNEQAAVWITQEAGKRGKLIHAHDTLKQDIKSVFPMRRGRPKNTP